MTTAGTPTCPHGSQKLACNTQNNYLKIQIFINFPIFISFRLACTAKGGPTHFWDAYKGNLAATYRAYNKYLSNNSIN